MRHIHRKILETETNQTFLYDIELNEHNQIQRAVAFEVIDGVVGGNLMPNPDNLNMYELAAMYNILLMDGVVQLPE